MRYNKVIMGFAMSLLLATSCSDEEKLPIDFDAVTGTNGAYMRVISIPSGSFNPFDMAGSEFVIELESFDNSGGNQLKEYRFYVDFVDNTTEVDTLETDEVLVKTIPASQFTVNATSGLPRTTVTITATESLAALGLTEADVAPLDQFVFRQELEMVDGRVYDADNTSGDITGGAFFSTPFNTVVPLVCPVTSSLFKGDFNVTYSGNSEFGVPIFAETTVKLAAGAQPYERRFTAQYLGDLDGGFPTATYTLQFICGQVFVVAQATGLGCGGGSIVLGTGAVSGTYDETGAITSFDVTLIEGLGGDDGGCGLSGANEVTMTFTVAEPPGPPTLNPFINVRADWGSSTSWPDASSETTLCDLADMDIYVVDAVFDIVGGAFTGSCPEEFELDLSGAGNGVYEIYANLYQVSNLGDLDPVDLPITLSFERTMSDGELVGIPAEFVQEQNVFTTDDADDPGGINLVLIATVEYADGEYIIKDQSGSDAGSLRITSGKLKEQIEKLRLSRNIGAY